MGRVFLYDIEYTNTHKYKYTHVQCDYLEILDECQKISRKCMYTCRCTRRDVETRVPMTDYIN